MFLALVVPACKTLPSDQQAADNSDLALLWQQVDSLKEIRLPRSALKLVQQIKGRSFRSEAWPNFIKSVIYENQFLSEMEGQGLANVIERMEMELAQTQEPATSIMHSILGEAYIQYLLNNLWRLRDQLPVQDPLSTIDAMSIDELKSKAITHHLQALNSDTLSVIPIQDYAIILQPDSLKDSRWETLFDLIANRSLDFFSTDYAFVTEPLSARELDEEFYFAATQSFASREIEMPSGLVSRFLAIQLYQRLLNQHLNDSDPSRLVELDLRRLKYVSDHSTHQDKEGLFIRALSSLSDQYRGHQAYAEIRFAEANQLLRNEKDSLSRVHAFDICSEAATRFPNSYGAIQCQNLMTKILSKSLQVECEKVVLPGEYNLIKIHYRNFSSVHLRVARLSDEEYWQLAQLDRESVISRLISLEVIEDAHYELPLPADFRQHSVEMILPPLAVGRYVLLIGSDSKFSLINNAVSVSFFQVSKLSFSEVRKSRSSYFICTNRKTGEALQNVEIAWMQRVSGREGEWKEIEGTYSDQNGIFHLMDSRHSLQVKLNYGNDSLWLDDRYISVRSPEMIQHRQVVYFFTDRSIYRPGQLIYFKGLALRFDAEGIPSLLKNRTVEASLRDVNGQDVSKATFRTNKFGSFHGSFRIPASGLKGSMSLGTDIGNQRTYFQVEAYKRPRFYVELDSLQQSAALGDTVWVNGRALGFAGFAVTDAEVTFRVLRSRVLRPWGGGWERGGFSYSPVTTQITQGTVTTDSSGRFSLDFVAADDPISFPSDSEFRFDVQVDVMDIAGETQSKLRSYVIGTEPFRFVIEMSSEWELGEPKLLRYRSINGDGAPIETSGTLTIERLSSTNRFVRRRYWTAPDQKYVSDKELQTLLPKDEWADELNPEHWPVTDTLETISLKGGEGELNLVDHGFIPGVYRLTTQVSDTHGHQVSETAYANVYAPDANYIPWQDAVWMSPGKKQYQPGDTATFWLASHDSISVWMECSQGDDVRQWFTFDGWKKLEIPVLPEDRGGFSVSVLCVYENRCTTWTTQVEV
ncbi:MAG: MG2 domain-containing protein, partial [Saprospiraceae bacterium]|nr:MG2 domain-containing protein [Saprospiraceae bacterium]